MNTRHAWTAAAVLLLTACLAPVVRADGPASGLAVGDGVSAFNPNHVSGPFKGSTACPT
jgi:hypothetical protein